MHDFLFSIRAPLLQQDSTALGSPTSSFAYTRDKWVLLETSAVCRLNAAQSFESRSKRPTRLRVQATDIGARILRSGGNAVDAAIAISAALCGKRFREVRA